VAWSMKNRSIDRLSTESGEDTLDGGGSGSRGEGAMKKKKKKRHSKRRATRRGPTRNSRTLDASIPAIRVQELK
jgi:hypothetical protein